MLTHGAIIATVASQVTFLRDPQGKGRLATRQQIRQYKPGNFLATPLTSLLAPVTAPGTHSRHLNTSNKSTSVMHHHSTGADGGMSRLGEKTTTELAPFGDAGNADDAGDTSDHDVWRQEDEEGLAEEAGRWHQLFPGDRHLSYLPLAHIYERALVEAALALGATVGCWQVRDWEQVVARFGTIGAV